MDTTESVCLLLVGASHRSAPLGLRECMSLGPDRKAALETALSGVAGLSGFVVLCTCNRVELYCASAGNAACDEAEQVFLAATGLGSAGAEQFGYRMYGVDAVRHLVEVCAGLDSEMIGETEIMGQVRTAYEAAAARGCVGPVLHRLFQKGFHAARAARESSGIGTGQLKLGAVAAEIARRIHGDLSRCEVLLVGSGQVGTDVARSLTVRGIGRMCVTSRTAENASRLAGEIGATVVTFEDWKARLVSCDVAILCTAAPTAVLNRADVRAAMSARRGRPLFLLDLAMPLDVEPSVRSQADVFLYTFADLAKVANENRQGRMGEVNACRAAAAERAERLWKGLCARSCPHDSAKNPENRRVETEIEPGR